MTASDTREALRAELEATRTAFHELLDRVPPALYDTPSDNPAWTVGQVLFHMSLAPRLLIQDVRLITKQSWLISLISKLLPRALFDWLNKHYTRFGARHPSHDFFARAAPRPGRCDQCRTEQRRGLPRLGSIIGRRSHCRPTVSLCEDPF